LTVVDAAAAFVAGYREELGRLRPRDVRGGGSVGFGMGARHAISMSRRGGAGRRCEPGPAARR
jgi:hypothetical protein